VSDHRYQRPSPEQLHARRQEGTDPQSRYYVPGDAFGNINNLVDRLASDQGISEDEARERYQAPRVRQPRHDDSGFDMDLYDPVSGRLNSAVLGYGGGANDSQNELTARYAARFIHERWVTGDPIPLVDLYTVPVHLEYGMDHAREDSLAGLRYGRWSHKHLARNAMELYGYEYGREGRYAAFRLMGVPEDEWPGWDNHCRYNTALFGRPVPDMLVWVYHRVAARFDVPFTPVTYTALSRALSNWQSTSRGRGGEYKYGGGATLEIVNEAQATEYCAEYAATRNLGVDPSTIDDFAEWVADGYGADSIVRFARAGASHRNARELFRDGVTSSRKAVRVFQGTLPLDWAVQASRARSE